MPLPLSLPWRLFGGLNRYNLKGKPNNIYRNVLLKGFLFEGRLFSISLNNLLISQFSNINNYKLDEDQLLFFYSEIIILTRFVAGNTK